MSRTVAMRGGLYAHASGALWIPQYEAAIVADAHLGYGWAQRRRGELGPVVDNQTEPKLAALIEELCPKEIVFLGDTVHAPKPGIGERAAIEKALRDAECLAKIVIVRGNHDRAFARDFGHLGFPMLERWERPGIVAIHGDRLSTAVTMEKLLILGHLHPAIGIRDAAGATTRLPAFLESENVIVLPAFSAFAAGFNVRGGLPTELLQLIGESPIEIIAISGQRAARAGRLPVAAK